MSSMTKEEALLRAREASAQNFERHGLTSYAADARAGKVDDAVCIQVAQRALLDIDKPPPVDPDLLALREIMAEWDEANGSSVYAEAARNGEQDKLIRDIILPIFRKHIEGRAKA